jgi:murein DD-endopeptidase MepM/ murein hydrolase activator NlpD
LKKIFLISFFAVVSIYAQEITFTGEARPASIITASGKDISYAFLNKQKLLVDKNGNFVFGFDIDAEGKYVLRVKQKNQKEKVFTYFLEEAVYEKQSLSLPKKFVTPPKKFLKKINREAALMKKARAKMNGIKTAYYEAGFIAPVDSIRITAEFGGQRILNGKKKKVHNGIDFGGIVGDSVYAISDGIVRLAGENFYYNGNFVLLDHGQGLSSIYLHLSKLHVKNNQRVKKGDLIGEIGSTGRSTGPHLHLGIQWYKRRIDPANVLNLNLEQFLN